MLLTRFAPTPSGYLHLGNAFSFIITWLIARLQKGKILLRIDDLDNERFRPQYLEDIFSSLEWLGLDYDIGPTGPQDFYCHWSQHKRLDLYYEALAQLRPYLFACNCSRKQWLSQSPDGQYPGVCQNKHIPLEKAQVAWRLITPPTEMVHFQAFHSTTAVQALPYQLMRHPVVRRKDALPAYQLASVVDDCHFGVNLVIRGSDLFASTAVQVLIAKYLNNHHFLAVNFFHHVLLKNEQGEKLSKSAGSTALKTIAEVKPVAWLYKLLSSFLLRGEEPAKSPQELLQRVEISTLLPLQSSKGHFRAFGTAFSVEP